MSSNSYMKELLLTYSVFNDHGFKLVPLDENGNQINNIDSIAKGIREGIVKGLGLLLTPNAKGKDIIAVEVRDYRVYLDTKPYIDKRQGSIKWTNYDFMWLIEKNTVNYFTCSMPKGERCVMALFLIDPRVKQKYGLTRNIANNYIAIYGDGYVVLPPWFDKANGLIYEWFHIPCYERDDLCINELSEDANTLTKWVGKETWVDIDEKGNPIYELRQTNDIRIVLGVLERYGQTSITQFASKSNDSNHNNNDTSSTISTRRKRVAKIHDYLKEVREDKGVSRTGGA